MSHVAAVVRVASLMDSGYGPSWRDFTDALSGLRAEMNSSQDRLREEMHDGFERTDRRIIATSAAIITILGIAITVAVALFH